MNNVAILNNQLHRQLAVVNRPLFTTFDGLGSITLFPTEFDAAHKEFPLFFRKHAQTGQFYCVALLSTRDDKNDFANTERWLSHYIPLLARRGPFLMHKQDEQHVQLCINLEDHRVGSEGERLFNDAGEPTRFTQRAINIMNAIYHGESETLQFAQSLIEYELLEPIRFNTDVTTPLLQGLYSVNPDKLKRLSLDALSALNSTGHLQWAYFLASSSSNMAKLLPE